MSDLGRKWIGVGTGALGALAFDDEATALQYAQDCGVGEVVEYVPAKGVSGMTVIEHSGPTCNRCGVTYVPEGEGQTCGEPYCNGRVTWEATADRLASQLRAAVDAETLERYRWALHEAVRFMTDRRGNPDAIKALLVLAEWGQ
jgi:hypothetical protein